MSFSRGHCSQRTKVVTFFVKIENIELDPPTPSPASECVSPWTQRGVGEQHSLAFEGVGGPNSNYWIGSLALCTLWFAASL